MSMTLLRLNTRIASLSHSDYLFLCDGPRRPSQGRRAGEQGGEPQCSLWSHPKLTQPRRTHQYLVALQRPDAPGSSSSKAPQVKWCVAGENREADIPSFSGRRTAPRPDRAPAGGPPPWRCPWRRSKRRRGPGLTVDVSEVDRSLGGGGGHTIFSFSPLAISRCLSLSLSLLSQWTGRANWSSSASN